MENESFYKSDNGDLVITKLKNDNLSLIISNVYVPYDGLRHKIGLWEQAVKRSARGL